jgi:hypothetical protein
MTGARTKAPASCEDLCPAKVVRALERSFGQIPPAARELGVPIPDLRRMTGAQPKRLEEALEEHELAVQRAMGVVIQALYSDDPRRQMWASDKILSSWLARDHPLAPARRRSAAADVSVQSKKTVDYTFRWRTSEDDAREAEAAEAERLRDEGKHAVSLEGADPEGGKTIEHQTGPESSNED